MGLRTVPGFSGDQNTSQAAKRTGRTISMNTGELTWLSRLRMIFRHSYVCGCCWRFILSGLRHVKVKFSKG